MTRTERKLDIIRRIDEAALESYYIMRDISIPLKCRLARVAILNNMISTLNFSLTHVSSTC